MKISTKLLTTGILASGSLVSAGLWDNLDVVEDGAGNEALNTIISEAEALDPVEASGAIELTAQGAQTDDCQACEMEASLEEPMEQLDLTALDNVKRINISSLLADSEFMEDMELDTEADVGTLPSERPMMPSADKVGLMLPVEDLVADAHVEVKDNVYSHAHEHQHGHEHQHQHSSEHEHSHPGHAEDGASCLFPCTFGLRWGFAWHDCKWDLKHGVNVEALLQWCWTDTTNPLLEVFGSYRPSRIKGVSKSAGQQWTVGGLIYPISFDLTDDLSFALGAGAGGLFFDFPGNCETAVGVVTRSQLMYEMHPHVHVGAFADGWYSFGRFRGSRGFQGSGGVQLSIVR